jgi:hypothetical protein
VTPVGPDPGEDDGPGVRQMAPAGTKGLQKQCGIGRIHLFGRSMGDEVGEPCSFDTARGPAAEVATLGHLKRGALAGGGWAREAELTRDSRFGRGC